MERILLSRYWHSGVFLVVGVVMVIFGYVLAFKNNAVVVFEEATSEKEIVVDVAGGVIQPGVYSLPPGSRLKDAVVAAGGLSLSADRDSFEKAFNLAEVLKDGEKIYVPSAENNDRQKVIVEGDAEKVSINKASKDQLMGLAGIGDSRAMKIIENRPYKSLEELVERKILSAGILADIKSQLTVW